jgi:hypothetical protein
MRTAEPLMRAAMVAGVHYLDFAAELDSYRLAEALDAEATGGRRHAIARQRRQRRHAGIAGSHAAARVADPRKISIALHVTGSMSRGSAISATENLTTETLARVDGQLVSRDASAPACSISALGEVDCFPLTLPDLITIWRTTGAPKCRDLRPRLRRRFPARRPDGSASGP